MADRTSQSTQASKVESPQSAPPQLGSQIFVANSLAATVAADPDDPTRYAVDGSVAGPMLIENNDGLTVLDLFLMLSHTSAITYSTACVVRCFGLFERTDNNRLKESEVGIIDAPADDADLDDEGLWLPITDPTTGSNQITFATSDPASEKNVVTDGGNVYRTSRANATVYTGGASKILVLVETVAAGTFTDAVILGRFGNNQ